MPATRINRLSDLIRSNGLDALAFNPGTNLVYLTGLHFHLMERPVTALFMPDRSPILVLPELEVGKIAALDFPVEVFPYGDNPATWREAFSQASKAADLEGKAIGVEPARMRLLEYYFLEEAFPKTRIVPAENALSALRLQKGPDEIEAMRRAVGIAQQALTAVLPKVKVGMTERELTQELVVQLLRAGSDPEMPFSPIVASGPNSANPHAVPSDRQLAPGDLLLVDWGASYNGYLSDLTRTFAIREVHPELGKIAQVVLQANSAGRAAGKPGLAAGKVDQAAREVIQSAGYGEFFIHRTGHGLGMEPHEEPYIFGDNQALLAPGMVYTVEPGIYFPGVGGVRIEDNVVVTDRGSESLSNMPRDLIVIA